MAFEAVEAFRSTNFTSHMLDLELNQFILDSSLGDTRYTQAATITCILWQMVPPWHRFKVLCVAKRDEQLTHGEVDHPAASFAPYSAGNVVNGLYRSKPDISVTTSAYILSLQYALDKLILL